MRSLARPQKPFAGQRNGITVRTPASVAADRATPSGSVRMRSLESRLLRPDNDYDVRVTIVNVGRRGVRRKVDSCAHWAVRLKVLQISARNEFSRSFGERLDSIRMICADAARVGRRAGRTYNPAFQLMPLSAQVG
jgi:hypothetical protein